MVRLEDLKVACIFDPMTISFSQKSSSNVLDANRDLGEAVLDAALLSRCACTTCTVSLLEKSDRATSTSSTNDITSVKAVAANCFLARYTNSTPSHAVCMSSLQRRLRSFSYLSLTPTRMQCYHASNLAVKSLKENLGHLRLGWCF